VPLHAPDGKPEGDAQLFGVPVRRPPFTSSHLVYHVIKQVQARGQEPRADIQRKS